MFCERWQHTFPLLRRASWLLVPGFSSVSMVSVIEIWWKSTILLEVMIIALLLSRFSKINHNVVTFLGLKLSSLCFIDKYWIPQLCYHWRSANRNVRKIVKICFPCHSLQFFQDKLLSIKIVFLGLTFFNFPVMWVPNWYRCFCSFIFMISSP